MKKRYKKVQALLLSAVVGMTLFAGCGGTDAAPEQTPAETSASVTGGSDDGATENASSEETASASDAANPVEPTVEEADDTTSYTYLVDAGVNSYFYEKYEDGPIARYWMNMAWDADGDGAAKRIRMDFLVPTAGSEKDYVNTLIATGEYPDVMSVTNSSDQALALYESGIAIDLTEYVPEYMPNYMAWAASHPEYADRLKNPVGDEMKYLQLYQISDELEEQWGCFVYRRDWIVRYGKHPETGDAFTGTWNEDHTEWTDDVVFPSGNTDPIYISDWAWMLDIFQTALKEQNISDGYAMQLAYQGTTGIGDLATGFNSSGWYYLDEEQEAVFGGCSDGFRAYVECMRDWYKAGYIDPAFQERTSDLMFWKIDTPTVYSGKVGLWYGTTTQAGAELDVSNGDTADLTNGIVVYGAPQPINDTYGDKNCQGHTPRTFFSSGGMMSQSVILTNKVEEKDIPTLLTALDYFYGNEGAILRRGFSKEQQAEIQDSFYQEWGLEDGIYTTETREDGETYYILNPARLNEEGLDVAAGLSRVIGLTINHNIDTGNTPVKQHAVDMISMYQPVGNITSDVTNRLSADEAEATSLNNSNIRTYMSTEVPRFIIGELDIENDGDWEAYCEGIENYHPQDYVDAINRVLGNE